MGQSRLETLTPLLADKITELLPPGAIVRLSATSKTLAAANESPLLKVRQASDPAGDALAMRSLEDFKQALARLKNAPSREFHAKPLTSLGAIINGLPELDRNHAASAFMKSVDEFSEHLRTKHRLELSEEAPGLMALYGAAKSGRQALADREVAVMTKHALPLVAGGATVTVALQKFGIFNADNIDKVEQYAINTRGRPAMNAGGNAQEVAERLGIDSTRLEKITASEGSQNRPGGPAYRAVTERGNKLQDVFTQFGIRDDNIQHDLAMACVSGPAGEDVRAGMSPELAAQKYGLDRIPFMTSSLNDIAQARDAAAYAAQSYVGWALRGVGRLVLETAKQVFGRMLPRTAAHAFFGDPGNASAAVQGTTAAMATHRRIGHARDAPAPRNLDDRLDQMIDDVHRELRGHWPRDNR